MLVAVDLSDPSSEGVLVTVALEELIVWNKVVVGLLLLCVSKTVDIFQSGKNIGHKVTHSLEDEKELDQFHRNWTKNWSNKGPNEK